jgi:hypothetical protein
MFAPIRDYFKFLLTPLFLPGHSAASTWCCYLLGVLFLLFILCLAYFFFALILHRIFRLKKVDALCYTAGGFVAIIIAICILP